MKITAERHYKPSDGKATQRYRTNTVNRVYIDVPKDLKPIIQEKAKSQGKSVNRFVLDAILAALEKD